nr:hypothetical protein [Tanacetum cinerariifolium]
MPVEVEVKGDNLTLRIEQAGSSFEGKVLDGGNKLSGTWQQPGLKTDLLLERSAAPAAALAAKKLRLTPPYRESEVTFLNPAGKFRLSGTLTIPSGEGPFAAQVGLLGHGEGANVALLAAAQPQNAPAFVVSLAGYGQPGRDVLRRQQGEIMRLIGTD